jgi:invasion protein IalB
VIVSAALRQVEGRPAQHLMVMVPPGVTQSAGLKVDIYPQELWEKAQKDQAVDQSRVHGLKLDFSVCREQGCTAEIEATAYTIGWMQHGGGMLATVVKSNGAPVVFPIPLTGFATAYAGAPVDNQRYAEARRQLLKRIEEQKKRKN